MIAFQGLDELQTHLLLRRVIKSKDLKPSMPSARDTAAGGPAPAAAAAGNGPAQAVLSADDVQAVADAYGQERAYLVKCQHLVLMTACRWRCRGTSLVFKMRPL